MEYHARQFSAYLCNREKKVPNKSHETLNSPQLVIAIAKIFGERISVVIYTKSEVKKEKNNI